MPNCLSVLSYILHREADTSHLVLSEALNGNDISEGKIILDMLNSLLGDLGNVYHSLLAGSELNECSELLDGNNLSLENLSLFELGGNDLDHIDGLVHSLFVGSADINSAALIDVDLNTGACDDLVDGLAALSDNITDLLGIDIDGNNLGSILADLCTGVRR